MKRLALLLLCSTAVLASVGDTSTTETSTARTTLVVATTPSAPGATKKVTPTPESSKPDATAPYIVHAQSSPSDSATARSVLQHPMSAHARPFRPSVQLLSRSDSFTGREPTYDVELASALDDSVMLPSSQAPAGMSAWPQRMPVGPVTVYTTPTPYVPPVAQNIRPRPHHLNLGSSYNVRPQHTAQMPYRPRRPQPPVQNFNRRVPMDGGRPPPPGLYRPVRQPIGPPRPQPQQKPFFIYSKPPPEVVYFGDHPPPLDYQPSVRRPPPPPHRPAYFSRPIPPEDEDDIMNILDHYIPDDEPQVIRKEPKTSPMSAMMMPMMLSGLIMPLFGMMFTYLSRRRRRRDLSATEHQAPDNVEFFLEMLNSAVEKLEKKSA